MKEINYEELHIKNIKAKCSICGKVALQDQYGNGECRNCGWKFSKDEEKMEREQGISYPMLVSPTTAREQYKKGLPFKATFDEFVNGLKFYSEMTLTYNGKRYGVFFYRDKSKKVNSFNELDGIVEFFEDKKPDSLIKYKSINDFIQSSNINWKPLNDIWDNVSFAGYMYCG